MSSLASLETAEVFALVPSFEQRCPVCHGRECATRLGVYRRPVVDRDGLAWMIPVPRFLCHKRGPKRGGDTTFSVLPAKAVPRRRWSLPLAVMVAQWCERSVRAALDLLSELAIVVEERSLRRWLSVLGVACERLHQHPLAGLSVNPGGQRRDQAIELVRVCREWPGTDSSPPEALVMAWQDRWLGLLLDVSL